jgi:lysophospholipase L1-like esterase
MTVFQGPSGSCIDRTRVVGYRCDVADPIIVFDSGRRSERRFLGGVFAVEVNRLPDDATVIGVGGGSQLVTVAGDDRRLYTVRGTSTMRWLALPSARSVADDAPSAFMVGDSLLDGAEPTMIPSLPGWTVEIDAVPGRGSAEGISIAESLPVSEQVVVVELGTNDRSAAAFADNAKRIVKALRDVPLVLWQNVEAPPDVAPAPEINSAIETLAGRRPNVAIVDWDTGVPEEFLTDGIHPDAAHQDAMATLVAPMLHRWWAAVTQSPAC